MRLLKPYLWRKVSWRYTDFVTTTQFGALMAGNSQDLIQSFVYHFGIWEPNQTSFLRRRLKGLDGRTFLDVGANIGYYSLLASRLMPAGSVVAVEAFPSIYNQLVHNIQLNHAKNIRSIPFAATDVECQLEIFHGGPTNEGASTATPGMFTTKPVRVPGKPLTDLLTEAEVTSMRMMKIDVEGGENGVLRGLRPLFAKFPQDAEFVVELTPSGENNEKVGEILDLFTGEGFYPYVLDNAYTPDYYLTPSPVSRPTRLTGVPTAQTDVVFSRVNAAQL
jgi:FkbM family methyltransferase